jgi:hypothetical protein
MHTAHEFPQDINREADTGCPPHNGAALKAAPPLWVPCLRLLWTLMNVS